jgi:hypothetical protein
MLTTTGFDRAGLRPMNRSTDRQVSDGGRHSGRTLQAGGHHAFAQPKVRDQLTDDPTGCPHTPPDLTDSTAGDVRLLGRAQRAGSRGYGLIPS